MLVQLLIVTLAGLFAARILHVCITYFLENTPTAALLHKCFHCDKKYSILGNLPIFGFFIQGGKCGYCSKSLDWIIPVVEILTPISFGLLLIRFGLTPPLLINALFFAILICLMFIDLKDRILPNALTLGGTVTGFLAAGFQCTGIYTGLPADQLQNPIVTNYISSAKGILFGGGFLWVVAILYAKIRKREGLGFGDIKMMFMVGAFLGWKLAWFTILFGSVLAIFIGGGFMLMQGKDRRYELPFGTFLGIAAMVATLWGSQFIRWYLGM